MSPYLTAIHSFIHCSSADVVTGVGAHCVMGFWVGVAAVAGIVVDFGAGGNITVDIRAARETGAAVAASVSSCDAASVNSYHGSCYYASVLNCDSASFCS